MTRTEAEWAAWARDHRAAFQTAPLVEAVEGERVPEVGLTFNLFPRRGGMAAVTAEERERMNQFEKRLLALGVKQNRA